MDANHWPSIMVIIERVGGDWAVESSITFHLMVISLLISLDLLGLWLLLKKDKAKFSSTFIF